MKFQRCEALGRFAVRALFEKKKPKVAGGSVVD
jgi:hypothetical protein